MEKREMMEQEIKRLGKVNPESEKKANPESEKKVNPESEKQDKEELDVHKENASGMRVWQADDVRGKLYFDNPELCAQFLRDYSGLEILKNVQPEDIEDVKLRYHLFDEVEYNSDAVKRIRLKSAGAAHIAGASNVAKSADGVNTTDAAKPANVTNTTDVTDTADAIDAAGAINAAKAANIAAAAEPVAAQNTAAAANIVNTVNTGEPDMPLYIVSLIDHKAGVDYNTAMQFLRYEVCIWADWEKEMRARGYGKPGQKGFRYPPVLPIVYYEGSGTWTADLHLSGRIAMAEMFTEYIPDFTYRVVRNHDYSNDELMERADEISLLMMLGKIQKAGDIEALRRIQPEQIDAIMKKASPAVVDILARTVWALCRKMNLPENEAEGYVRNVKEGKMGYIFENMEKMDIQEERRKTAEARQELQAARQAVEAARQEVEAARQELQAAQKNLIESFQKSGADKGLVIQMLCSGFSLSQADAEKTVNRYWESSAAH